MLEDGFLGSPYSLTQARVLYELAQRPTSTATQVAAELGLVGEPLLLAAGLAEYGLELWDGSLEPGRLAFVGEKGRTLILVPPGRGWLPTGRPAEPHPVDVLLKVGGGRIRRIRLP